MLIIKRKILDKIGNKTQRVRPFGTLRPSPYDVRNYFFIRAAAKKISASPFVINWRDSL